MSQFNAPVRRTGGGLDVFTGLLFAAFVVLATGAILLATRNMEHSGDTNGEGGGMMKMIDKSS